MTKRELSSRYKAKYMEGVIYMAEFLAYRILMGKLTIDQVPERLKAKVQEILNEVA